MNTFFPKNSNARSLSTGFTATEMIISLAVLALIMTGVYYAFSTLRDRQIVRVSALGVKEYLVETRSLSLSSQDGKNFGVHFETDRLVRFAGTSYSSSDPSNETYLLDSRVAISQTDLDTGGSEIYWSKVKGGASTGGTIAVSLMSDNSLSEIISVSRAGLVELNQ